MNETIDHRDPEARWRSSAALAVVLVLTVAVSAGVYLECIHLLGFPDGHVSEPHRIRRVIAFAVLGLNALAVMYYAVRLASLRTRPWRRVAVAHAVLASLLLGLIVACSSRSFPV